MPEILKAITGPMFSGKTTELLCRVNGAETENQKVLLFKPLIDNRWGDIYKVISHNEFQHDAIVIQSPQVIINLINNLEFKIDMIAIDEIQFFGPDIIPVIKELLDHNIEINFAGLPLDFRGEPFGQMLELQALASDIKELTAICECGAPATRTQRLVNGQPACYTDPIIMVGAKESYTARCESHHVVPGKNAAR